MQNYDSLSSLHQEHANRQLQRIKYRAPILFVTGLILLAGAIAGVLQLQKHNDVMGFGLIITAVVVAFLWSKSAQLLTEWDRAVVLRMGRFQSVRGPGFFMIIPIIDSVVRVVDMRVRTTAFYSDANITRDTVPVGVDAIAFWHVWDSKKAVLELESYYQAIVLATQTALRDIVGVHSLAEILSERDKIGQTLQKVLQEKTESWGITVNSTEIRDIAIPENLRDALSKQAQAERERQARTILGQAEQEIAEKFMEAAKSYQDNPVALQLRAMNILYEGMRSSNSTIMLVPSSTLDTMNLGGLSALAMNPALHAKPKVPPPAAS